MDESALHGIPGGQALMAWFGYVPHFHDAELRAINLASGAPSSMRIHAFRMTDQIDAKGYFVLDKHVIVTFTFDAVVEMSLRDFHMQPGIIGDLTLKQISDDVVIDWDASYGVYGTLRVRGMRIDLQPGKPE